MTNSDTLLVWLVFVQFAFFLSPALIWLIDRGIHMLHQPPVAWAGRRIHSHGSKFERYRDSMMGGNIRHA